MAANRTRYVEPTAHEIRARRSIEKLIDFAESVV